MFLSRRSKPLIFRGISPHRYGDRRKIAANASPWFCWALALFARPTGEPVSFLAHVRRLGKLALIGEVASVPNCPWPATGRCTTKARDVFWGYIRRDCSVADLEKLRDALRAQLSDSFHLTADNVDDETLLFSSGMLDSFVLLEIVSFVEQFTGAPVRAIDINLDNFDSIARIAAYVQQRGT